MLGLAVGLACAQPAVHESVVPESDAEESVDPPPSEPEPLPSANASEAPGEMRSREEIMAFAIYTPDPDAQALMMTKAARIDKTDGRSIVQFCVEPNGSTSDVRTIEKFPGDPMVDQILRDTIATWRFKRLAAVGISGKVCTQRVFVIHFN